MEVEERAAETPSAGTWGTGRRRLRVEAAARTWVERTPARWFRTSMVQDGEDLLILTHRASGRGSSVDLQWVTGRAIPIAQIEQAQRATSLL